MKTNLLSNLSLTLVALACMATSALAQTSNNVSNVGFSAYNINGASNPTLTLMRGVTYRFQINASGHPFWIKTSAGTGTGNAFATGVTGNGTAVGTVLFAVPTNAPATLFYNCQFHVAMKGTLNIIDPPSPPPTRIVSIQVGAGVVIASTGAAGWAPVPEYSGNVSSSNWAAVPAFTNVFANGTNTTSFDRLEPLCGSNVFLRVRQRQE